MNERLRHLLQMAAARGLACLALGGLLPVAPSVVAAELGVPYVQVGHSDDIYRTLFTPDGRFAVSGAQDRTARVWDVASGREIRSFPATVMALSPDGTQVAAPGSDGDVNFRIRRWELASGRELPAIRAPEAASLVFTPDGRGIVVRGWNAHRLSLYDVATGKLQRSFAGVAASDVMAVSPDGRLLVVLDSEQSQVDVWEIASGKKLKPLPFKKKSSINQLNHLAFSADGSTLLASGYSDLAVWDAKTWSLLAVPAGLNYARFGADSRQLVGEREDRRPDPAYSGPVSYFVHVVHDLTTGRELRVLPTDKLPYRQQSGSGRHPVTSFSVSADGRLALFATNLRTLALFDLERGIELRRFSGEAEAVASLDLSPDGRRLALGSAGFFDSGAPGPRGRIWDLGSARLQASFAEGRSRLGVLRFSPDGGQLVTGFRSDAGRRADAATGKDLGLLMDIGEFSGTLSADGTRLLSVVRYHSSGTDSADLRLIDARSGAQMRKFETGPDTQFSFTSAAISADGRQALVGANPDGTPVWSAPLALWDLQSGKVLRYFDRAAMKSYTSGVRAVAVSPDGTLGLSTKSDTGIKLWDLQNGKLLRTFIDAQGVLTDGTALAFSRDGKRAAAGYDDGQVALWDVASGRLLKAFPGHGGRVNAVALSADGLRVFSASDDTTARVWSAETGREILQLVGFSDGEWIAITPEGYFNASPGGARHVNVRTGAMAVSSVDAYYEAFYRPDIAIAALRGIAVETGTSIARVKPAPSVEIVDTPTKVGEASVAVTLRITDQGGGVGDVRLYRNGSAVSLESGGERGLSRTEAAQTGVITRKLQVKLLPGSNVLRAAAFDTDNQVRSDYAELTVESSVRAVGKPTLHAVVIGINSYRNPKLTLNNAVADAELFAQTLAKVGAGLFERVAVTKLTTREDTTREAIAAAIAGLRDIAPGDLFVFYVASHGTVDDGSYFLITSNVGSVSTERLKADALSQAELTKLLANIPAGKKLVVLDTCNSGALGSSLQTAMLTRGLSDDTAAKVLSRAVGSSILSSATSGQEALEGYLGHGLFTYVISEGLAGKADANKDGFVTTAELLAYVDEVVPQLAQKVFGREQFPTVNNNGQVFPVGRAP